MAGGSWDFNTAFEFGGFEPNIDDAEDFKLSTSERFGSPLSEKAIDQAISDRVPEKNTKGNAVGSQRVLFMV